MKKQQAVAALKRKPTEPINVNVKLEGNTSRIEEKLDRIICLLEALKGQGDHMSAEMDRLETEVREIKTVAASATALIRGIAKQLKDAIASQDPARLTALADSLDQDAADLSAAVAENTAPASAKPSR